MDKKINIAVVGCGRIAQTKHFKAITENSDYQLVAVCDSDAANLKASAERYQVAAYADIETMLQQQKNIELVSLCTPSGLHPQQTQLCAKYGKHVVTEKPMSCQLSDAKNMIASMCEAGKKLFVVKQNRLNPTVVALKQAIESGAFGKIYMVHCNVFWTRPQDYYDMAKWRGTWAMDGGAFMNQASHYVDLLEYLVGKVNCVQAMTKTLARNIEAEDSGVVNFEWQNGAIGSMAVTMLTYPKNLEGSITILGEKGTVRLDGVALNEAKIWQLADAESMDIDDPSYIPDSVYGNGHIPYYENVADVLLRGGAPISDGESGLKSIQLLDAIYRSAKTGNTEKVERA